MPELPDLVHLENVLSPLLRGRRVQALEVRDPIVLRVAVPSASAAQLLAGRTLEGLRRHGPFLVFRLPPVEMVIHFMLAGRLQLGALNSRRDLCFTVHFDEGPALHYLDERRMGKVYLVAQGDYAAIPGFANQGVDLLSGGFTATRFRQLIAGRRCQLRVFLMDQSALSAVGNAYADEILFAAGLHPKTPCHRLTDAEVDRLYRSVGEVLAWGIEEVKRAAAPLEAKVRGHLKVRGRRGEPCPVCGTVIRRTGVLGYDAFFCPRCQPAVSGARMQIPWDSKPDGPRGAP